MLVLSYILTLITIIFFYLDLGAEKIGQEIQYKESIRSKLIFIGVLIAPIFICSRIFGINGIESFMAELSYVLLLSTMIGLVFKSSNAEDRYKDYYKAANDQLISDTDAIKLQREELEVQKKTLIQQELDLETTSSSLSEKQNKLDAKSKNLKTLEKNLSQLKSKLHSEEKQLNTIIHLQVSAKEKELRTEYANKLSSEKEKLQEHYNARLVSFTDSATQKMQQRIHSDKKELLDDVFSFEGETTDDFFEMKQLKESLTHEKEEIEKSRFLVEMEQKVSQANEHVINAKSSALDIKSENVDLRTDLKLMANDFSMGLTKEQLARESSIDSLLHKLEKEQMLRTVDFERIGTKLEVMDAQTKARFVEMHSNISLALKDLQMHTANGFREVGDRMGEMKLQFGQEVMRLDGQQGKILSELEKYHAKNQQFVNQCQQIAIEAKRQNLDGQQMLNQVDALHHLYKTDAKDLENRLRTSMDQISVKEGQLANSVGESMLKLKSLSEQTHASLRDIALEKKDINLHWREKNGEHERNLQEVRHQKQELDMTRKLHSQEQSAFDQHKSSVMENARLTHRNYMQEQEYKMAMFKAENSGGWLSRWARNIEKLK